MLLFQYLPFLGFADQVPIVDPVWAPPAAPSVTIKNGTVVGSTLNGVDSFIGIPFAQPPIGNLRLRRPQTIDKTFGTFQATGNESSCPQLYFSVDSASLPEAALGLLLDSPLMQRALHETEDCLTIKVQRPAGTTSSSKLPVLFWIFGGGFELGSTGSYDGSTIIKQSVSLGQPIVYVAVNYRIGAYGFMGGDDLTREGNTNLGLRDQRKGMEWVQENIAAFGGDPDKVTIWGESAGSISVFDHLIINEGDNTYNGKALFRGAIMNSGSATPTGNTTAPKAQVVYNNVVAAGGCSGASDKLACLRSLDYETFLQAANSNPGISDYQSLDLSYLPRPDPASSFFPISPESHAKIASVPIIIGDQEDEGTVFALVLGNISTNAQRVKYLESYFPYATPTQISDLVNLYPDDISAGSPFDTGPLNELYPGFKKNAAILGDITFTLTRRATLAAIVDKIPKAYSYLSSYSYGTPILGTFHGSDIFEIYNGLPDPLAETAIQTYYISFVNSLDPNAIQQSLTWPQWTNSSRQLVNFQTLTNTIIQDDFRDRVAQFLSANSSTFRV